MDATQTMLIDANKLFREGLRRLLDGSPFAIVAEAGNLREAVSIVEQHSAAHPQLVLLDLATGNDEEAEALRRLRKILADAKIVVLTSELCTRRLANALEAGADGYLMKDLSSEALTQSLRLAMMGEKVFPTHLAALLINGRVNAPTIEMPVSRKGLSQREVQILRCLLNGDSNKMIANQLNITEATVKVHLKSLLRKINASNRTQAAIWALNNGIGGDQMAAPAAAASG